MRLIGDPQLYPEASVESTGLVLGMKWVLFNGIPEPGTAKRTLLNPNKPATGGVPGMAPPRSKGGRALLFASSGRDEEKKS